MLSDYELQQLDAVISLYKEYIDPIEERLPQAFLVTNIAESAFIFWKAKRTVPVLGFTIESFKPETWLHQASVPVHLQNAITGICAYQSSRAKRFVGGGHLKDPTNLLCEHLKRWIKSIAMCGASEHVEIQDEINRYICFIRALESSAVFPTRQVGSLTHHDRTMQNCLSEVVVNLEKENRRLDEHVSKYSLRDLFTKITALSQSLVNKGVQFLFKVLQSNALPVRLTREEAVNGCYGDLVSVKETRAFKLTKYLALSEVLKACNHELHDEGLPLAFGITTAELSIRHEFSGMGSALARARHPINTVLGGNLIPDRSGFRRWWGGVHSGVSGFFQAQQAVLEAFVRLHLYIEQIALFSLISSEIEVLADFFGTYKWATVGKHLMSHVQLMYAQLQQKFLKTLQVIYGSAQGHYRTLSQRNETGKVWCQNFRECQPIMRELTETATILESKVKSIKTVVELNGSPRRVRQMQDKLVDTVGLMNQFCLFNQIRTLDQEALVGALASAPSGLVSLPGSPVRQTITAL